MSKIPLHARIEEVQDQYLKKKAKQKRTSKSVIVRDCIDKAISEDYGSLEYFNQLFNPKKS